MWLRTKGVFVVTALRQRMLEDLQIRNYAPTTVAAYIRSVAEFAKHFGKSPELPGAEQIREYQPHLISSKRMGCRSPGTPTIWAPAIGFLAVLTHLGPDPP